MSFVHTIETMRSPDLFTSDLTPSSAGTSVIVTPAGTSNCSDVVAHLPLSRHANRVPLLSARLRLCGSHGNVRKRERRNSQQGEDNDQHSLHIVSLSKRRPPFAHFFEVFPVVAAEPSRTSLATSTGFPSWPFVSVALTTTRSPALMSSAVAFAVPFRILVFSFKVITEVLPSVAFTSRWLSWCMDTVPMILCTWPSCARAAVGIADAARTTALTISRLVIMISSVFVWRCGFRRRLIAAALQKCLLRNLLPDLGWRFRIQGLHFLDLFWRESR